MPSVPFQVGGTLRVDDPTYIQRRTDNELYDSLSQGKLCYVLTSRQMGKSSLMLQMKHRLSQAGWKCLALDLTSIGTEEIDAKQWYKGICVQLWLGFDLGEYHQFQTWWSSRGDDAPLHFLADCLRQIVDSYPQRLIAIFIDELDSVLALNFPVDDFFALIRYTYNQRAVEPAWQRLTFALFGVAKPSDLIRNRNRTAFNIGQALTLEGFSLEESQPLAANLGLPADQAKVVLSAILYWTAGQPFLTQKLCRLVWQHCQMQGCDCFSPAAISAWMKDLVQRQIIHNWEAQDDPEHLRTIRDRILGNEQQAAKLLGLLQILLRQQTLPYSGNEEETELLLSGLVSLQQGRLRIKNRIYAAVFNADWVAQSLARLRPYSALLQQWVASNKEDAYLLQGTALVHAQDWQRNKRLDQLDYEYLQASEAAQQKCLRLQLETAQLQAENDRLQQAEEVSRLKTRLLTVVSSALVAALGLSFLSWQQYQRAKASEVRALATSSQGFSASNQQLEAMVAAVKANQSLQQLINPDDDIQQQVEQALNQTVLNNNEHNQLTQHEGGVLTVDISPDGNTIITGSNDKTARLWARDGRLLQTLNHQDTVHHVTFSPTGDRLVTGSLDGTLQVWNLYGQRLHHIQAHRQPVWGVAVSPDGTLMASASSDHTIKLWRADGTLMATLPTTEVAWRVAFSPDGTQIAAAILDGTIQRWTPQGRPLPTLRGHQAEVWDVAWCPRSNHLVSASSDHTIKVWDAQGTLLKTLQPQELSTQLSVDCSGGNGVIAASGKNNAVTLWDEDGTYIRTLRGHRAVIRGVALGPDGTFAASASDDGTVRLWQRHRYLLRSLEGHSDTVWSIAVSPDGQTIASVSGSKEVILWQNFRPMATLGLQELGVTLQLDSNILITSGFSDLHAFPVDQLLHSRLTPLWQRTFQAGPTFGLVVVSPPSPRGAKTPQPYVATGSDDGVIRLWNPDGSLDHSFLAHRSRIWQLAASPDGQRLVSASEDGTVKLWQTDGTLVETLVTQKGAFWGVAFSPGGDLIAATSLDDSLHLWRLSDKAYQKIPGQSQGLTRVAFSPDGQIIATGGIDSTVKLWNRDGTLKNILPGHQGLITSLAFSPDGRYLYSGSDDSQIIRWDIERIATLDPLNYACNWIGDYLKTSEKVAPTERNLCRGGSVSGVGFFRWLSRADSRKG